MTGRDGVAESVTGRVRRGPLLVAVALDSSLAPLHCAADVADRLGSELVVVHVDEALGSGYTRADGTVVPLPMDPDLPDDIHVPAIRALHGTVESALAGTPVSWRWEERCGDPAHVLAKLADEVDASCIVLGAPHRGLLHALARLAEGSVVTRLTHHQARPVLIVPDPTPADTRR
jgi:nucleotide-binding universal stress UspA family protein